MTGGWLAAALMVALLTFTGAEAPVLAQEDCTFTLGFEDLHDLAPDVIGDCVGNEVHSTNGDSLQQTTRGLLVWRKADNWTTFTDGATTWLNGPCGLQSRPNEGPFFAWEGQAGGQCVPGTVAAPPKPAEPPPAAAQTIPAPTPTPIPPPPAPWVGDLVFGWAGSSERVSGGDLKLMQGGTLLASYRWTDVPPGSKIKAQVIWGIEGRHADEITVSEPSGRRSLPVVSFPPLPSGNYEYVYSTMTVILYLDGKEVGRGTVSVDTR